MLCKLSKDVDGIQMVKMASRHIKTLIPQVSTPQFITQAIVSLDKL